MSWKGPVLAVALSWACLPMASAQGEVVLGAHQFSNGVHPTFDAVFEDPGGRTVTRFWLNELKGISMKVTNRKEMTGAVARIPSASPDTMRVQIAVERARGGMPYTSVHVAFFTTTGYVGPDSPERELNGCQEWMRQRSLILRRQLAQEAVDQGERRLTQLERQLDMLRREEQRAGHNIRRTQQRMEDADRTKAEAEERLQQLQAATDTTGLDSAALATADKERGKQERLWQDRSRRSTYTKQGLEKKLQDLQWELTKNGKEQVAKQAEIEQQQATVAELRERLRSVH